MYKEFNATHVRNAGEGRIKYDFWVPSCSNCMSSGAISPYKRNTGEKKGLCNWFGDTELAMLLGLVGNIWSGAIRGR